MQCCFNLAQPNIVIRDFVAHGSGSMVIVTDRRPILKQCPLMIFETVVQIPLSGLDIA